MNPKKNKTMIIEIIGALLPRASTLYSPVAAAMIDETPDANPA
jgi:hypothetical protein